MIISEILKQIFDIFKTEVKTGNRIEIKFSTFLKCLSESQSMTSSYYDLHIRKERSQSGLLIGPLRGPY